MDNFIPYGQQWIDEDDKQAVLEVLGNDYLTQGPKIEEFEKDICQYTGAKYCVTVANGTAALHIAVAALDIPEGKEGITTTNTFAASANCLVYNRLKPIFADIDPKTYNISVSDIEKKITSNTKVIIPVHIAGQSADVEKIAALADKHHLYVIEDAAHAIGSKYADGSRVGNCKFSELTTFSFHPVKTITTGEGGAVTTNSEKLYQKLLLLRSHGITKKPDSLSQNPGPWYYEMQVLGYNYRLTDIQAALGISQLNKIEMFIKRRRDIVNQYNQAFAELKHLTTPYEKEGLVSAFHLYVLRIAFDKLGLSRKEVMIKLKDNGIGTQVHYIPVHTQPYYQQNFGYKIGDYPIAEEFYTQALCIPLYPKMTDADVKKVISEIKEIVK